MTSITYTPENSPRAAPAGLSGSLRRAEGASRLKAYLLIAPLFLFLLFTFALPIVSVLWNSVDNPLFSRVMPRSSMALQAWDAARPGLPSDETMAVFAEELRAANRSREVSKLATQANFDTPGLRNLLIRTGRAVEREPGAVGRTQLQAIDAQWASRDTWAAMRRLGAELTPDHYLHALDLRRDAEGVSRQPTDLRLYMSVALRTFWISGLVAAICLLLGYPLAYFLAHAPARWGNLLLIMVLLPFWTSMLVRTVAWVVVLQTEGVLNSLLLALGLIDERIQMVFNRFGVVVAMVHILLPYMVLSLYSVMKSIPPAYVRAARSLGANAAVAFWRVYVPQTLPGVFAGVLLVFILALGFYVAPAILGGANDQMVSFYIADHLNNSLNWGLAAALGALLLIGVMTLYAVYARVIRAQRKDG